MLNKKVICRRLPAVAVLLVVIAMASVCGINAYMLASVEEDILTYGQAAELDDVDCILVLGCGVNEDGQPKSLLTERLQTGIELYTAEVAPKLLMSGDHGRTEYDEVNAMKSFAIAEGVPSEDIFMDHAGFSTYESMYRAKAVFAAGKIVVVSQAYHLPRAVYIAKSLGLEAYGVAPGEELPYRGEMYREFREMLARCKDFAVAVIKPLPTYLGEEIPVSGNGDVTNDEYSL